MVMVVVTATAVMIVPIATAMITVPIATVVPAIIPLVTWMPAIAIGVIVIVINGRAFAYRWRPGYHYRRTNANSGQRWKRYPEIQPDSGL